ncbi:MAG: dihydroneopterin aldolase [Rhodospirillales bacterium]|nr:dihydroneopterin aldolase [Rhodospirillales bacterium]
MVAETARVIHPIRIADARNSIRHVFIRDLLLECSIGVHRHEHGSPQRVRINLDLAVRDADQVNDDLANVVCYEKIANGVRMIIHDRHVKLVETLAEDIAAMVLEDPRVCSVRVRIEKLDVFADASSVGVEIERFAESAKGKFISDPV